MANLGSRTDAWLGLSPPAANTGLRMRDNGVCLVDEHSIVLAVSEERLSRVKHDYRVTKSLRVAERIVADENRSVRRSVYSTCSDSPWTPKTLPTASGVLEAVPSHHYSHALSAFIGSPYEESLVVVSDAGGNILRGTDSDSWWSCPREQTSAWYGIQGDVHLLERYHDSPHDIGFGEWYRAFTYFLGWPSHTLSGNTMALSAYGEAPDVAGIWDDDMSGTLSRRVLNDPRQPIQMVQTLLRHLGFPSLEPRLPKDPPDLPRFSSIAAFIQRSLQSRFSVMVTDLRQKYNQPNLCLSGGVAQNCVMAAQLAHQIGINNVFVSAYSADVGQCVGNALLGRLRDLGPSAPPITERVFLGPSYSPNIVDDVLAANKIGAPRSSARAIASEVAQRIESGQVVAVYRGRSEFGARALGHRSVLCDPLNGEAVRRVKLGVKQRDEFMPLAPVVGERVLLDLEGLPVSQTMTFAPKLKPEMRSQFGESMHVDGSARVQIASTEFVREVLAQFELSTGRCVLINTSFNKRGAPMVETPDDALAAASNLDIDCLVLEDRIITKAQMAR